MDTLWSTTTTRAFTSETAPLIMPSRLESDSRRSQRLNRKARSRSRRQIVCRALSRAARWRREQDEERRTFVRHSHEPGQQAPCSGAVHAYPEGDNSYAQAADSHRNAEVPARWLLPGASHGHDHLEGVQVQPVLRTQTRTMPPQRASVPRLLLGESREPDLHPVPASRSG